MWSSEHDVVVVVTGGQGVWNNQLAHHELGGKDHEVHLDVVDPDSHEGLEAKKYLGLKKQKT